MIKSINMWFKNTFKLKGKKSNIHTLVIAIAIVMIWRDVRGILDKFLFPNHELLSYIVGAIIWIIIIYIDDKKIDELGVN